MKGGKFRMKPPPNLMRVGLSENRSWRNRKEWEVGGVEKAGGGERLLALPPIW